MGIVGGLWRVAEYFFPVPKTGILAGREPFMRSSRPPQDGTFGHPVLDATALSAFLRAGHLLGLALGSALGRLRESGETAARIFAKAEEQALLLRMAREAAGILGAH